ncbi:hypothetical protein POVWA1_008720 [Plasmodium ovale wallikeri]|uniref:Uncharacterized protein n=1 Tax=Plasmodium ovale wallikeri TaxID=864142 RepID=A0A1A8YJN4_PLAOA|nr:hypothetical protein POVWA1_008720 [Plasmodium ovale wallikeri]
MAESTRIQVRIYAQAKQFNCAKAWYETKKMRIQWGHATKVHVCANKRSRKKKKKKFPFSRQFIRLFSRTQNSLELCKCLESCKGARKREKRERKIKIRHVKKKKKKKKKRA